MDKIIVYYDGSCPICIREMNGYKRYEIPGSVEWFDITNKEEILTQKGIDPNAALLELHVQISDDSFKVGVEAFILLWSRAPRLKLLAWLVSIPGIKYLVKITYGYFTRKRLEKDGRLPIERCKRNE